MRGLAAAFLALALVGCAAPVVWAPDDAVAQARYREPGPTRLTLLTMISNSSGAGGHSALVIDTDERLIFDPAGSWFHPAAPERNDVIYGMQPVLFDFYMDYHARETYHVVVQEIDVSPEVAAFVAAEAKAAGPVPQANCSRVISSILGRAPGFESIRTAWLPERTMAQFGAIAGVRETRVYDDDSDDNYEALQAQLRADLAMARARENANAQ